VRRCNAVAALLLALACGSEARHHPAHGVVVDVARELGQIVIEHDAIPGLMPAMTMNFEVPDAELLARLEPGQEIAFEVEFEGTAYRVVGAEVLSQRPPRATVPRSGRSRISARRRRSSVCATRTGAASRGRTCAGTSCWSTSSTPTVPVPARS
jgi:Cu/Ag efflux protein CusF